MSRFTSGFGYAAAAYAALEIGQLGSAALHAATALRDFPEHEGASVLLRAAVSGGKPLDAADTMKAALAAANAGRLAEAIASLRALLMQVPECAEAWSNLGTLLGIEESFAAANAALDRAFALAPAHPQIRLNRAIGYLRAGEMASAWPDYEARLDRATMALPRALLMPDIGHFASGAGLTVLLWHEEGFGDTLHFVRYAPLLAARGFTVVAWLPAPLARLAASVRGIASVVTEARDLPHYDWHVPVFSLPRVFGTTVATIPAEVPYLEVSAALRARWAKRVPARRGRLRVGLCWHGQARPWDRHFAGIDERRSLSPLQLAPFGAVEGVQWIALQKDAIELPPFPVFNPMPEVTDFADTAAILMALDLVVSVDTSMVHVAGGLGRPVLMLDRYDCCWRWALSRERSPWYPSMRIVRQASMGDWAPVLCSAAQTMAGLVKKASESARAGARNRNGQKNAARMPICPMPG
jgi:hypothetical protein